MDDPTATPEAPGPGDLPHPVRQRLVSLVATVLPDLTAPPAPLRRVRDFAPARRARAGAVPILAALGDDDFRQSVARVVGRGAPAEQDDPPGAAARAWLSRPEGWQQQLEDALAQLTRTTQLRQDPPAATPPADPGGSHLTEQLGRAERALAEARAENARLRRTLGEERRTRRVTRAALQAAHDAVAEAEQARATAESAASGRERELRQAQSQLARHEAGVGAERRAVRVERDEATVRTRLLLDTLLESADGLRRELGLPPATGTPAEQVEQGLASEGVRDSSAAGVLGPASGPLLDSYLSLPRARLVVDGYNVTKSVWGSVPLESQRIRLVRALAALVARTGAETTVVFDAHQVGTRPVVAAPRGVRVVFSPEGVIADDVIRDLVAVEPTGRVVLVVTDDAELARDVRRDGARVYAAAGLLSLLGS